MTDNNSHTVAQPPSPLMGEQKGGVSKSPLGDLGAWVETTLGEVCEIKHGFAFKGEFITDQENENILLTPGNFEVGGGWKYGKKFYSGEIPENYVLKKDDLVVTMTDLSKDGDTLGYPALIPDNPNKKFLHNQRVGLVITKENIDKFFLHYLMKWRDYQKFIVNTASGSTVRHTSPTKILEFDFSLPPLSEQKAIASVLSAFDDKIELLREQNKTLEEMGQVIFKEWFGKYGVDDELPEGWRVGKLGEENFAEIIGSGINEFDGDKIYLATADVSDSNIINTNEKITFQERPSRANIQPIEKSIWFAKMQDSRKLLMFDDYSEFEIENFILSTGFAGIKTTEISHYFMWCFILSKEFDELKNNMANGAVQIAVNNTNLRRIEIIIPDNETLAKFNELAKPIFKKIYDNSEQIQSLARSRDVLLPKLMRGEVRVDDFSNN